MARDPDRLVALAAAISDGARIDWQAEINAARAAGQLDLVACLHQLAEIAEGHRSAGQEESAPIVDEIEATQTVGPEDDLQVSGPLPEDELLLHWGPLEIMEKIGAGAFGEVYCAWDARLDREVALKLLRRRDSDRPDLASSFIQEGCLLARVRHPNVATVYGAEIHDGRVGLWMEFIRGRTLSDLLREQGHLGPREAAVIGLDLCRASAAVHGAGLVHRDIKAQNVMREEGGRVVLMDFGAGRDLADHGATATVISGTPMYMAPEVFKGERASARTDIYSLGVLLYHLVTGSFPVRGQSFRDLADAHASGARTLLRDARPDLPETFVHAVERALHPDPQSRFSSAGQFEQALTAVVGVAVGDTRATSEEARSGRGIHRWLAWGIAVAVLVVAAVTMRMWLRERPVEGEADASGLNEFARSARAEPGAEAVTTGDSRTRERTYRTPATTLNVKATLYKRGAVYHPPLSTGDTLALGDEIYLEVENDEDAFVYIVNQDSVGHAFVLFPFPGSETKNPLRGGSRHLLPGSMTEDGETRPLYWKVDSAGGKELFLVVASRKPLADLERQLAGVPLAQLKTPAEVSPDVLSRLRGVGTVTKPEAPADGSAPPAATEALRRISGQSAGEQVWIREILLENPGS